MTGRAFSYRSLVAAAVIIAAAALASVSCRHSDEMDPELAQSTEIRLKIRNSIVFEFDPLTCQLGYVASENTFIAGYDDMGAFFMVVCDPFPAAEGMEVTADIKWKTSTSASSVQVREGVLMKVYKTDDTGLVWLWSEHDRIGAVVKILN